MAFGDPLDILLYKDARGKWRWRHQAANGRIDAASEQGFATKWGAKRSARKQYRNFELLFYTKPST